VRQQVNSHSTRQVYYVDERALGEIESRLAALVCEGIVSSIALIDWSGAVLASAGDLPLPPDQMGATAAGIFSAVCAVAPLRSRHEFVVQILTNQTSFRFVEINERLFLWAFSMSARGEKDFDMKLRELAERARDLIGEKGGRKPSSRTLEGINEKLTELLSSCKKPNS
jgi:hypothetical protein